MLPLNVLMLVASLCYTSFGLATAVYTRGNVAASIIGGTNISTHNPSSCEHPTRYFRQKVDHNLDDASENTFLQQYQVVSDFWKPGGPILFYQGAEDPEILCLEDLSLPTFAQELGAFMVGIEHRYFGASIPHGLEAEQSANWTLAQWDALSLENVLQDSVTLLKWLKETNSGLEESKVITFGGSYGAFLAALEKIQFPKVFHGAIPTCGVYNGLDTSPNSTSATAFCDTVSGLYSDISWTAASRITDGFDTVRKLMAAGNFSTLSSELSLCTLPSSSGQTDQLLSYLLSDYVQNAQFGFSPPLVSSKAPQEILIPPHEFPALINETLAAPSDLAALSLSINNVLTRSNQTCLPWDGGSSNTFSSMQLIWIVCNYFPYPFASRSSRNSIFGEVSTLNRSSSNVNEELCEISFGISAKNGDRTYQRELGISQEQMMMQQRMFLVTAQYDPTTGLGLNSWPASADRDKSRWWFMAEAGHTEDILKPSTWDTQPLKDTREAQLSYMKSWLDPRNF